MRLSDIQNKDVISITTGMKIGSIIDVKVDSESGKIVSFIIEKKKFPSVFSNQEEIEVLWSEISKIGEDVILVESSIK